MIRPRCDSTIDLPASLHAASLDYMEIHTYECELPPIHSGLHMISGGFGPVEWSLLWTAMTED